MDGIKSYHTDSGQQHQGLIYVEAIWIQLKECFQEFHHHLLVCDIDIGVFDFLWLYHVNQDQEHFRIKGLVYDSAIFGDHFEKV